MSDIVKRLRGYEIGNLALQETWIADMNDAAAEIDRLRRALEPFVRHAHCVDQIQPSNLVLWCAQAVNAVRTSGDATGGGD